ncbi:MAG: metal-dependent transcriptional regulator, partial [Actinomycetota bacterium]|nr:metal-dependent transcriptional regulator [Actinomycetota bacterium]
GYVTVDGSREITLTADGRVIAEALVRRHRLAERMLVDILGIPWHLCHEQAEDWEKVMTPEVEDAILAKLEGEPTCPHGNPIPGAGGPERDLSALADSEPGDQVRLERVTEQVEVDLDALVYLDSHGFIPGVDAEVRAKAPDGTLTLALDGGSIALGPALASQLYVARV